jgi:hypothetical protein
VLFAIPDIACGSSSSKGTNISPISPSADASAADGAAVTDAATADADFGTPPTVTGPITGPGQPYTAAQVDLGALGYVEEEYFIEGDAQAYDYAVMPPSSDGMWSINKTATAQYKSRFLVHRPSDPSKFNGLVFVEWLNVSGGADADPDFDYAHVELLRSGWAYVGISAQSVGIMGGGFSLGGSAAVPLVKWNSARYGSLMHPGDDYSYDIYSQAARFVRHPPSGGPNPMGNLTATKFVATGESQSAGRMVTYTDAIQPMHQIFDAIFIHSRSVGGAPLNTASAGAAGGSLAGLSGFGGGMVVHIRSDLNIPVFQFQTETDVVGGLGGPGGDAYRQPDTDTLRTWEIAGTSHADQYLLDYNAALATDSGAAPSLGCMNINTGPQHWLEDGAVAAMQGWLKDGTLPPKGDPLEIADGGGGYAKDSIGNTLGGVRSAAVDVPISTLSGSPKGNASILCALFGSTTPLSTMQLQSLYPTHDDYVSKVTAATNMAQQAGFIVAADVPLIVQEAQAAHVPQ